MAKIPRLTFEQLTETGGDRGQLVYLRAGLYTLEDRPLAWQRAGLQQTRSGYGKRLTSTRVVRLQDGRIRRVYVTCYSNSGTAWITLEGRSFVIVRD